MAKVTFRLPSKAVQYGYVEIEVEVDERTSAEHLGETYANYVKGFWEGEKGAKPKAPDSAAQAEFERQLGATKVATEKHTHKFVYGDDDNGHSGSYCECGEEEPVSEKPWSKKTEASAKPWENKPDLFG